MKTEKPILFKGEMVRAIIEGRKTQTRRLVKAQPKDSINDLHGRKLSQRAPYRLEDDNGNFCGMGFQDDNGNFWRVPYGEAGTRLWVKETFQTGEYALNEPRGTVYRATDPDWETMENWKWKPSIFMPRAASRLTLEIIKVSVERLQDITEAAAIAEGCIMEDGFPKEQPDKSGVGMIGWDSAVEWYSWLWEEINGEGTWDLNPWVWVIEFKKL